MGSACQRAAKLLVVKVGGNPKKTAALAITAEMCASMFSPGLTSVRIIPKFNRWYDFVAHYWATDPISPVLK